MIITLEGILKIGYIDTGAKLPDGRKIYGKQYLRIFYDSKNNILDGPYKMELDPKTKEITYSRLSQGK